MEPASLPVAAMLTYATALEALTKRADSEIEVQEALHAAEAAEVLMAEAEEAEDLEVLAVEVKMLVAKLMMRTAQAEGGFSGGGSAGNGTDNRTEDERKNDEEKKKPLDPYETLQVPKNATGAEVKRAYRKLALQYHPDKNSAPEAVQIFMDVQKSYEILMDPVLRRRYDQGQDVSSEDVKLKPMKFKVVEVDRERGVATVWWYDPNTGEEGYMERPISGEEGAEDGASSSRRQQDAVRPLFDHCCLPATEG